MKKKEIHGFGFGHRRVESRSSLKSICPLALQRFDRQMGKYRARHWELFRDWMGWEPKKEKKDLTNI